jgi:hypothetical protein
MGGDQKHIYRGYMKYFVNLKHGGITLSYDMSKI